MKQKRVIAVHDISCIGRCSLTSALPILSSAGAETLVLPTALLSTQTGGFEGYTFLDLTGEMKKIIEHWKTLRLDIDSVYTGYLGSIEQIEVVEELISHYKRKGSVILVDPVMGDAGNLYDAFSAEYASEMKKLCAKADIIVPNLTEACLLTGTEYIEKDYPDGYIERLLRELCELGPEVSVISGVHFADGTLGAYAYDSKKKMVYSHSEKCIEGFFHGTGDVFASTLLSALLCGKDTSEALRFAVKYTADAVARTKAAGSDVRHGVDFESGLCTLCALAKE